MGGEPPWRNYGENDQAKIAMFFVPRRPLLTSGHTMKIVARTLSKEEIHELPVPQRLELIGELWNSVVEAEDMLPITDEERKLLDEAIEEHRRDPGAARPWDEVRREIFGPKKR